MDITGRTAGNNATSSWETNRGISPVSRRKLLEGMHITNVIYDGEVLKIAVPSELNMRFGAKPMELSEVRYSSPQLASACTMAGGAKVLGGHARRFVKKVDWQNRVIIFKGKHHPKVRLPEGSDGAWKYMERLLTSDLPGGWVKLGTDLEPRWSGHFYRPDENGVVDPANDLTNLLCRIESNRKRGRPPSKKRKGAKSDDGPMIHLVAFRKAKFDKFVAEQKEVADNSKTPKPTI